MRSQFENSLLHIKAYENENKNILASYRQTNRWTDKHQIQCNLPHLIVQTAHKIEMDRWNGFIMYDGFVTDLQTDSGAEDNFMPPPLLRSSYEHL